MMMSSGAPYETELINTFTAFLRDSEVQDIYRARIDEMVEKGVYRLLVDIDHIRQFNSRLAMDILRNPVPHINAFCVALQNVAIEEHADKELRDQRAVFNVGLTGSFGSHHLSPRKLLSRFLGQLVCLEGIVTKMSVVKPKLVHAVAYCSSTGRSHTRSYRDWTSLDGLPTNSTRPRADADGNALEMDFGHCIYKNSQSLTIQEMPERSPLGQLPRSVEVILDHDLVDIAKPGDRVVVVGLYRAKAIGKVSDVSGSEGRGVGLFDTKIIAISIRLIGKEISGTTITHNDLANIREIAKRPDSFKLLSRSLAPSICGHDYIKQSLLLLLLGGMEKNLKNGTHIRGDINILLVGDPSTAKSQLLRFTLGIAPLAVSTTGRGSSGVGLTAAVTTDPETRERRLEAGAMVLADRGVVCIDEFDKMDDKDRVAIHEVMEQQTITVAKAGIHATLNARCSVLAAANPLYGQYDRNLTPQRNVDLPDSLLSRFDLLFIVLDTVNAAQDRLVSSHILRLHRFERPGMEGQPFSTSSGIDMLSSSIDDDKTEENTDSTSPVFQKFNPLLHSGFEVGGDDAQASPLHSDFIRKYIHYAKNRFKPQLTEQACELINAEYSQLRQETGDRTLPTTARALESFVRLATAHAKARLSNQVDISDVEATLRILRFALFKDSSDEVTNKELEAEEQEKEAREIEHRRKKTKRKSRDLKRNAKSKEKKQRLDSLDILSEDELDDSDGENLIANTAPPNAEDNDDGFDSDYDVNANTDRYQFVRTVLREKRTQSRLDELSLDSLMNAIKAKAAKDTGVRAFSQREVMAILNCLETDNRIMYRDGRILFV